MTAKFATKCNKEVREHVLVRSNWKKFQGDTELQSGYYSKVAVSTYYMPVMFI